ncbi:MAG TPA: hypothetical protein VHO50_09550 [Bacteroidales bacterium]|nr:hypothetical protein [Bacteroidales bacterium]
MMLNKPDEYLPLWCDKVMVQFGFNIPEKTHLFTNLRYGQSHTQLSSQTASDHALQTITVQDKQFFTIAKLPGRNSVPKERTKGLYRLYGLMDLMGMDAIATTRARDEERTDIIDFRLLQHLQHLKPLQLYLLSNNF